MLAVIASKQAVMPNCIIWSNSRKSNYIEMMLRGVSVGMDWADLLAFHLCIFCFRTGCHTRITLMYAPKRFVRSDW